MYRSDAATDYPAFRMRGLDEPDDAKPEAQESPQEAPRLEDAAAPPAPDTPVVAEADGENSQSDPAAPAEEETSEPAGGVAQEGPAPSVDDTTPAPEPLVAASLDAESENPIIPPSESPEES